MILRWSHDAEFSFSSSPASTCVCIEEIHLSLNSLQAFNAVYLCPYFHNISLHSCISLCTAQLAHSFNKSYDKKFSKFMSFSPLDIVIQKSLKDQLMSMLLWYSLVCIYLYKIKPHINRINANKY